MEKKEQRQFTDIGMNRYFASLSPMIQESIMQSGIEFKNEAQLRSFVKNIKG